MFTIPGRVGGSVGSETSANCDSAAMASFKENVFASRSKENKLLY